MTPSTIATSRYDIQFLTVLAPPLVSPSLTFHSSGCVSEWDTLIEYRSFLKSTTFWANGLNFVSWDLKKLHDKNHIHYKFHSWKYFSTVGISGWANTELERLCWLKLRENDWILGVFFHCTGCDMVHSSRKHFGFWEQSKWAELVPRFVWIFFLENANVLYNEQISFLFRMNYHWRSSCLIGKKIPKRTTWSLLATWSLQQTRVRTLLAKSF